MIKGLLLILVGLLGVAMTVIGILNQKENNDKWSDNQRIKKYNTFILSGGIAIIVLVFVLFFIEQSVKATTRFAFGWGSAQSSM